LVGFDPLAFVAKQLELDVPAGVVEAGAFIPLELSAPLPLEVLSPDDIHVSLPLGVLPERRIPIRLNWEALGQAGAPLAEGTAYVMTGAGALARSFVFVPQVNITLGSIPVPSVHRVRVTLTTGLPGVRQQTVGPLPLSVAALQVPQFIALFHHRFFGSRSEEAVQVLFPNFYLTQAPGWCQTWEGFQSRINNVAEGLAAILALFGGDGATRPPGSRVALDADIVGGLSAVRGALDYVANRPQYGRLAFMQDMLAGPQAWWTGPGIGDPFEDAQTLVLLSNSVTEFVLATQTPDFNLLTVTPASNHPAAILTRDRSVATWRFSSVFGPGSRFPASARVTTTSTDNTRRNWSIYIIQARFPRHLYVNNEFPARAAWWRATQTS
jgi:hypothetical protein